MTFDFLQHALVIDTSDAARETLPLRAETVAAFHERLTGTLHAMGIDVRIWTMPVEVPEPIRFEQDTVHRSYDPAAARTFWEILLEMKPILETFRGEFIGKCSPVHFFWGSFDLAVTRFSGRPAPPRANADAITREAYSHEVISHGWWPGRAGQRTGVLRLCGTRARGIEDGRGAAGGGVLQHRPVRVHPALRSHPHVGDSRGGSAGVPADHLRRRGDPGAVGSRQP
jgi:hypothetical protein